MTNNTQKALANAEKENITLQGFLLCLPDDYAERKTAYSWKMRPDREAKQI